MYPVSCILQQLGCRQSSHASSDDDHVMRCVDVWKAGLHCLQQFIVIIVLQTISQMFLQADSIGEAAGQREQQHADSNWSKVRGTLTS